LAGGFAAVFFTAFLAGGFFAVFVGVFVALVVFAAFVGVRFAVFFALAAGAFFDPTRAGTGFFAVVDRVGTFFVTLAGTFRALVDLPVALAIGRSLRSLRRPDGENGGC